MYKLNNILLSTYGILPGRVSGEGIAVKGIFDLPKRIGITSRAWAESNGVEPYVAADEIFLGGRDITFQGIMLGTKAQIETNLFNLKTAIDAFTATVPFETPYGNACVIVQKMTPKIYIGGATVVIEFREPKVGANCGVNTVITTYYSAAYSETAIKNNCAAGYDGSTVTFTSVAGKFTSTVSQYAANLRAIEWVREGKQDYANVYGTCALAAPTYYNVTMTGSLARNNCGVGYTGSVIYYTVEAFKYSSKISQLDANAKAQAEIDANLTQTYANSTGTCSFLVSFVMTEDYSSAFSFGGGLHTQTFKIGEHMQAGTTYSFMLYGIIFSVTSVAGDTAASLVTKLLALINAETNWNKLNMLPAGEGNPTVTSYAPGYFTVWLSYYSSATVWIGNPPWWDTAQA